MKKNTENDHRLVMACVNHADTYIHTVTLFRDIKKKGCVTGLVFYGIEGSKGTLAALTGTGKMCFLQH